MILLTNLHHQQGLKFLDKNGDGEITWPEYAEALAGLAKKHNYQPTGWDYATATVLFLYTDFDKSGTVSFDELNTMYHIIMEKEKAK